MVLTKGRLQPTFRLISSVVLFESMVDQSTTTDLRTACPENRKAVSPCCDTALWVLPHGDYFLRRRSRANRLKPPRNATLGSGTAVMVMKPVELTPSPAPFKPGVTSL